MCLSDHLSVTVFISLPISAPILIPSLWVCDPSILSHCPPHSCLPISVSSLSPLPTSTCPVSVPLPLPVCLSLCRSLSLLPEPFPLLPISASLPPCVSSSPCLSVILSPVSVSPSPCLPLICVPLRSRGRPGSVRPLSRARGRPEGPAGDARRRWPPRPSGPR